MKGRGATSEERARIFTPGNTVPSYGGHTDTVLAYDAESDWARIHGWYVTVQGTEPDARIRQHATNPVVMPESSTRSMEVAGLHVK